MNALTVAVAHEDAGATGRTEYWKIWRKEQTIIFVRVEL